MTRRQRREAIIKGADRQQQRWLFDLLMAEIGLDALTDEALDRLATMHEQTERDRRRTNARSRAIYAGRAA